MSEIQKTEPTVADGGAADDGVADDEVADDRALNTEHLMNGVSTLTEPIQANIRSFLYDKGSTDALKQPTHTPVLLVAFSILLYNCLSKIDVEGKLVTRLPENLNDTPVFMGDVLEKCAKNVIFLLQEAAATLFQAFGTWMPKEAVSFDVIDGSNSNTKLATITTITPKKKKQIGREIRYQPGESGEPGEPGESQRISKAPSNKHQILETSFVIEGVNILVINVHIPTTKRSRGERTRTLKKICKLFKTDEYDMIFVGGDLNTDDHSWGFKFLDTGNFARCLTIIKDKGEFRQFDRVTCIDNGFLYTKKEFENAHEFKKDIIKLDKKLLTDGHVPVLCNFEIYKK